MKFCRNCGKRTSGSLVKFCPYCGYAFESETKSVNETRKSFPEKQGTPLRSISAKKAYMLAEKYYNGDGVDEDLNKAFELYLIAAEKGLADAQYKIGYMYAHGEGVKKNLDEAIAWYMKADKKGQKDAQYEVGEAYYYGKGIKGSYRKAFNSYLRAAEQDHDNSDVNAVANAQYSLGFMYANGEGVKRDLEKAFYWLMKAAKQGHAKAQYYVGEAYYYGEGIKGSDKTAFRYYKDAAEQDHTDAQYALGYMYYHCQGVREDLGEAAFWLNKAAYNGSKEAKELLKKVYENSTLYVYRGKIDCIVKHHQFVPATAVLVGEQEKTVELSVNYCLDCLKLLISESSYKLYRKMYGDLIGDIQFDENSKMGRKGPMPRGKESTLMLCGYNVNAKDDVPQEKRRYIISKLLDMGIMEKSDIIFYLDLFISLHKKDKSNASAVKKWRDDLKFTNRYKINKQTKVNFTDVKKLPNKKRIK